ncbi:MAG: glycoside hydrolase family 18 protein [Chlamydiales bacterium]
MADPVGSSDGGYKIENGTWYLDYRSWTDPIPEGVNCVNLFEGKLDIVNGQYTIDGLNSLQVNQLKTFIEECHNHVPPIAVKVSLGGAGGQTVYNNTWDQLMNPDGTANPTAIQGFAAGMASFCHEYGIDGIDFDYEEDSNDPNSQAMMNQEQAVGQLIAEYKKQDPSFQTSICTNAGFGGQYGWEVPLQRIFQAAQESYGGACPIDRLYIMSYTSSLSDEENWITQWANWAKTNYGFEPAQISVGIDPTSGAYDYDQMAQWAASQGYSSCMWAWDPGMDPNTENGYAEDIWNRYHPTHN